jgi:hypothetical protein
VFSDAQSPPGLGISLRTELICPVNTVYYNHNRRAGERFSGLIDQLNSIIGFGYTQVRHWYFIGHGLGGKNECDNSAHGHYDCNEHEYANNT